jgi:ribonuclease-3
LPHEQTFKVECSISLFDKKLVGSGVSRKKAEQHAAELMLAQIAGDGK